MSIAEVQERYARFAKDEAPGRSALYERWALAVAHDEAVAEVIAGFAQQRRQPPLVFAVMRLAGLTEHDDFAAWVRANAQEIYAAGIGRSVQTNEPLRCAAIMPALAGITQPIALIEVGAAAGLCLFPDRYGYEYLGDAPASWRPAAEPALTLTSEARGTCAPPLTSPNIVWRAGIDLNPLDAAKESDRAWLQALVWPGEVGRAERIAAALDVVAADPPVMVRGSGADVLADVVGMAPAGTRIVITTPGVLPLVPRAERQLIIERAQALSDDWITLDPPALHDAWCGCIARVRSDGFALARNGRVLAAADPLGRWIEWFDPAVSEAGSTVRG